jgi:hypothetical protein
MHREYFKDTFIDNFGRTEDVSTGYGGSLVLGQNFFKSQQYSIPYYFQIGVQHADQVMNCGYFYQDLSFLSFTDGTDLQDAAIQSNLLQYIHLSSVQTLAMRIALVYGYHWSPSRTAYLGGMTGLRGFGPFDFAGQRSVLMNIEDRIFTPVQLWFFKLGGVIFYDCGTAWKEDLPMSEVQFRSSVGLGLRIENEKQQGTGILRFDFAYDISASKWGQITLSTEQLFSPLRIIDLLSPSLSF